MAPSNSVIAASMASRRSEVAECERIIGGHVGEFAEWHARETARLAAADATYARAVAQRVMRPVHGQTRREKNAGVEERNAPHFHRLDGGGRPLGHAGIDQQIEFGMVDDFGRFPKGHDLNAMRGPIAVMQLRRIHAPDRANGMNEMTMRGQWGCGNQ